MAHRPCVLGNILHLSHLDSAGFANNDGVESYIALDGSRGRDVVARGGSSSEVACVEGGLPSSLILAASTETDDVETSVSLEGSRRRGVTSEDGPLLEVGGDEGCCPSLLECTGRDDYDPDISVSSEAGLAH